MKILNPKSAQKGFTLMETIISLFVLMMIIMGVYSLIVLSVRLNRENKYYVEAIEIANQKMEQIRNLPYKDVGVQLGIPSGTIPQVETIIRNGTFTVNTYVKYYPDIYDGLANPEDPIVNDYKIATIKVSWQTSRGEKNVTVFSKIIPRTVETNEGLGLLKIVVSDTAAQPVAAANVRIINGALATPVDVVNLTNSDGVLYFPTPTSTTGYEIIVSKPGFSTSTTFDAGLGKSPLHLVVSVEGNMTTEGFVIDLLGTLNIRAVSNVLPENQLVNEMQAGRNQTGVKAALDSVDNMYFTWASATTSSSYVYVQKYSPAWVRGWANDRAISATKFQSNPVIATANNGDSFVVWQDNSSALKLITKNNNTRLAKTEALPGRNRFVFNLTTEKNDPLYITTPTHSLFLAQNKGFLINLIDQVSGLIINDFKPQLALAQATGGLTVNAYTGSIPGATGNVTITPVADINKAFVLMQSWWTTGSDSNPEPDEHQATAYLSSNNTVSIERTNSSGDVYFSFYVIEAPNDEFIVRKRGQITIANASLSNTDTVSGLSDDSRVVIFANSRSANSGTSDNDGGYATVKLTGGTPTWTITADRNDNTSTCYVRYEVVEWLDPGVTVQTGEYAGNVGIAEVSANITNPVDTGRTWLYATMRYSDNGLAQTSVRAYLKNQTTVGFIRRTNSYNAGIRWWAIEFPAGVRVERGSDQAAAGDSQESQAITAVDLTSSWSDSYRACDDSSTSFPRDRWEETLSTLSNLRWQRLYVGSLVDFSWQVIDTSGWTVNADVEVSATGTQITSILTPASAAYLGGAFVVKENNGSRNVTAITITENGTVDAQTNLDNIELLYDFDQSNPYDCASVSLNGDELQFGLTDTDGFNSANGLATFNDNVNITTVKTLCLYPVLDILSGVNVGDTLDIKINNPATELTVDAGTISPNTPVEISDTTLLLKPAELRPSHYRFRNNDGDETAATWKTDEDNPAMITTNTALRLRFSVSNSGSLNSGATLYRLEYGEKTSTCGAIGASDWHALPNNDTLDWRMIDSTDLTDGAPTTDLSGLNEENPNFIAGETKDTDNQSAAITLAAADFTEIEYSIRATNNASDANSYCFRLTNAGATAGFTYSIYPEVSIVGDENIYIIGLDTNGNDLWTPAIKRINIDTPGEQTEPALALTENFGTATTVVVWQDDRNGHLDIYAQSYDLSGNRLWLNDLRVTSSSTDEFSPVIAIDQSDNIFIAWVEENAAGLDIYMEKYDLNGAKIWTDHRPLASLSYDEYQPALAVGPGNKLYLSWTEDIIGIQNSYIAEFSGEAAKQWESAVNVGALTSEQTHTALAADNTFIYATWTDDRNGNDDIYAQKFNLSGAPEWTNDQRLNIELSALPQNNPTLLLNSSGQAIASWSDKRSGYYDVYAAEFNDPSALSGVGGVQLLIHGTQTISETPRVYEYDEIHTTDANGYANIVVRWDSIGYSATSTNRNVILRDPLEPLKLNAGETKNWTIYVE